MKLLRDVICQVVGKGLGCPIISATTIEFDGNVSLAMGGRSGGGGTQNVTQNTAPWVGQQGYLSDVFQSARDISHRPQTFFPGQTYANFSPQTEQALNLTEQRALAGSPVQNSANAELQRTLNGDYLHGGQGFNAAYQAARNQIIPDVESRFARGGRFGSGLARTAETRALADAFASQYGNERQHQLQAMLFAPQAAASDYADASALARVGAQREDQTQNAIDEAMQRHNFAQSEPQNRLENYARLINGQYGEQGNRTQQGFRGNRGAGLLGGALGGAGLASLFGTAANPIGIPGLALGGILGGLTGLF